MPVSSRPPNGPSCASSRLIVGIETSAAAARSSCDHVKSDRAALTCRIDTFGIDSGGMQHNMWVVAARTAVLSVITGGGKWVEIATHADPLYQHLIVTAERKFWRCVENGEPPRLFGVEPPKPRIEAVRVVDMSGSNSWAEFAGLFRSTRHAFLEHERSKAELKALIPEDAKEAIGHGVRAKRSKTGAISFDVVEAEDGRAAI
jgi:hypothetical protein